MILLKIHRTQSSNLKFANARSGIWKLENASMLIFHSWHLRASRIVRMRAFYRFASSSDICFHQHVNYRTKILKNGPKNVKNDQKSRKLINYSYINRAVPHWAAPYWSLQGHNEYPKGVPGATGGQRRPSLQTLADRRKGPSEALERDTQRRR